MKSDRFIPSSTQKSRHFANMGTLQESNKNIDNDPKVTKLYRMLVMDPINKAADENQSQFHSLKTIAGNEDIENSYEYLSKFGIDIGRI